MADRNFFSIFHLILICSCSVFFTTSVSAQSVPGEEPILRISQNGHSDRITQLELTPDETKILTVSVDKTLKIWRSEDMRLLNTVRMPIADGFEGSLYALAVSPNGKLAAISGWTGYTFEKSISIYLVDIETGHFTGRISGLDEIVTNMRFGPDGKYLYAGLTRNKGFRVIDYSKQKVVAEDRDYQGTMIGIEFLPSQIVSTTSHDGKMRFYDNNHRIISSKTMTFEPESLPTANRATADGRYMALGFMGAAKVMLLDIATDKAPLEADASCFKNQVNTPRVFWDRSNTALYSYGTYEGEGGAPLYRWKFSEGKLGACERIETSRRNFTDIDIMSGSRMAIATTDPSVGIYSIESGQELVAGNQVPDFRRSSDKLRISFNGDQVVFPLSPTGKLVAFSLYDKVVQEQTPGNIDSNILPATLPYTERVRISGELPGHTLLIDGKQAPLAESEIANDAVITKANDAYIATEFGILRLKDNKLVARRNTPSHAEAVAVSGDRSVVVALLADGTVRWHRSDNLAPIISLFSNAASTDNEIEWVSWVPEGFYVSSNNGDSLIGWHLNNGMEKSADLFTALQYERVLYSPAIVNERFKNRGATSETTGSIEELNLRDISPGLLDLDVAQNDDQSATLKIVAKKRKLDLQILAVFVNDIPVLEKRQRVFRKGENSELTRTIEIPLFDADNRVRVEISNGKSFALAEIEINTNAKALTPHKGDLHIVSIGVSEFPNASGQGVLRNLNFTHNDATKFLKVMVEEGQSTFNNIYSYELSDYAETEPDIQWPTKQNILKQIESVTAASAHDTVIIFLASHGFSDKDGNYFFVPRDAQEEDLESLLDGGEAGDSLIAWEAFLDVMRRTSGRRILVVDTCSARNINGPQDTHSLAKRSASARFGLVAAAKGDEESLEVPALEHGLFTWSLIQALKNDSDANGDSYKSLAEIFEFSIPLLEEQRVKIEQRVNKDIPQTPQLIATSVLKQTILVTK